MSRTISAQDKRQTAPGDTVRHNGLRGVVTAWGPLALLSMAFSYACTGIFLQSGALPSIDGLAAPYRPVTVFLIAAAPMLVALVVASLRRGSGIRRESREIRAFGIGISLSALVIATVWYLA